ncbi:uncharacterized protein LOC122242584 [Penaeus japonicus]|uniref:uncharacterized protein LOC122242584 n=1 Tax=Penaeus japonicus TaxID=27405 RepID=UPI001C70C652|nr:uncharacterized protein LOC122242584 [Penaeus japonicus]XP_042855841.1 uncharacterized protein LOC122242584 [Penaeus japonicus]
MASLLYAVLMCTVAVALSTPASNEKWQLMGKLITDLESGAPTLDEMLTHASPTPIGDESCSSLHSIWKGMPDGMREKISDLQTSFPVQDFSRSCYWSWNARPGTCQPHSTSNRGSGICYRTRYYAILGRKRYCCSRRANKPPQLFVREGRIRCRC